MVGDRLRTVLRVLRSCPLRLPLVAYDWMAVNGAWRYLATRTNAHVHVRTSVGAIEVASLAELAGVREVFVGNVYLRPGFRPRAGWTVVDTGANVGAFTAWASGMMGRGNVVAIEPVPQTYARLARNAAGLPRGRERSGGCSVTCVPVAVGPCPGVAEFVVPGTSSTMARLAGGAGDPETRDPAVPGSVRVLIRTLEDAIVGTPAGGPGGGIDLLKLDVEGAEAGCLEAADGVLARTARVVFEYHGDAPIERCAKVLRAAGLTEVERRAYMRGPEGEQGISFWWRPRATR